MNSRGLRTIALTLTLGISLSHFAYGSMKGSPEDIEQTKTTHDSETSAILNTDEESVESGTNSSADKYFESTGAVNETADQEQQSHPIAQVQGESTPIIVRTTIETSSNSFGSWVVSITISHFTAQFISEDSTQTVLSNEPPPIAVAPTRALPPRPTQATALENPLGAFKKLPRDIRYLLYSQLDYRSLGNLELASGSLNLDIQNGNKWKELAQKMQINTPAYANEANTKAFVRIKVTKNLMQQILANPENHGLRTCDLYLAGENFSGCTLEYAALSAVDLRGARMGFARLGGADLHLANLEGALLGGADLRSANLDGTDLRFARLGGAKLMSAKLRDALLHYARLKKADLTGADLRGAEFIGADLREAKLDSAKLLGTDFRGANLRGTGITPELLDASGSYYDRNTRFPRNQWVRRVFSLFFARFRMSST